MTTLLTFLIVLGLLVFVHELGHFVAARILGVGVKEFGFGFPPRLWGIRRKETTYSINWIPLGGFVRLHGEDGEATDPQSFSMQKAWKRTIILVAGVLMNVVLAIAIFAVGFSLGFPTDITDGVPAGARARDPKVQIVEVQDGSAAVAAGLQVGDALVRVNGAEIVTVTDAQAAARAAGERAVTVVYTRGQEERTTSATLQKLETTGQPGLGVSLAQTAYVSYHPLRALWEGIAAGGRSLWYILQAFGQFLGNLIIHQSAGADVAGPVGIAVLTGQVAKLGFTYLLQFVALLSLNLAIINILPIPALDGGRLLFVIIEKLRGKPLTQKLESKIHGTSFAILIGLIALVTLRDVFKLDAVQHLWERLF
ncbi:MAG: RIP metalloprotease RseP [Patescibacteria group bacterium]